MGKHTMAFIRDDGETEIEVEYSVTPGCGEMPPAYAHGGLPAEDPEVEIQRVRCLAAKGYHASVELTDAEERRIATEIAENPDWWTDYGPDPDDARDAEIDRRLCESRP
jgi:hypothetical protein